MKKQKLILLKGNHHHANFNISSILPNLNQDLDEYYTYHGSLTTPPCDEGIYNLNKLAIVYLYVYMFICNQGVVSFCWIIRQLPKIFSIYKFKHIKIWTIFKKKISISTKQLDEIRGLNLNYNHRNIQPLYNRKVYASFCQKKNVFTSFYHTLKEYIYKLFYFQKRK